MIGFNGTSRDFTSSISLRPISFGAVYALVRLFVGSKWLAMEGARGEL